VSYFPLRRGSSVATYTPRGCSLPGAGPHSFSVVESSEYAPRRCGDKATQAASGIIVRGGEYDDDDGTIRYQPRCDEIRHPGMIRGTNKASAAAWQGFMAVSSQFPKFGEPGQASSSRFLGAVLIRPSVSYFEREGVPFFFRRGSSVAIHLELSVRR
jgi:hypothetical protein